MLTGSGTYQIATRQVGRASRVLPIAVSPNQFIKWHIIRCSGNQILYNKDMNKTNTLKSYYNGAVLMNESAANDPVVRLALDAMEKRQFQALEVPTGGTWYISDRH